jgi:hypothetical protein
MTIESSIDHNAFTQMVKASLRTVVNLPNQAWRIACIVALRALDVAIATGNHTWEENAKEYEEITRIYPELVGP